MGSDNKAIFDFDDYKEYLLAREQGWPGRGMRKELADAMGCQAAYVSQVLNGHSHFSLEQCEKANALLGHTKYEAHFFLLLVQRVRAGTEGLRTYFNQQMEKAKKERKILRNRVGVNPVLNEADQATYYSHPYYALVHMAVTIPEFQTPHALSDQLKVPIAIINQILEFLTTVGLVERQNTKFVVGKARIHLPHDSKLIYNHHRNWRLKAIDNLNFSTAEDLHYSSVVTLSVADFAKLREQLVQFIENAKVTIRESAEEEMAVFNIDFFTYKK
ncbi:MAG: TIGR02147 family protein [Bdellovibrionales bacterium]